MQEIPSAVLSPRLSVLLLVGVVVSASAKGKAVEEVAKLCCDQRKEEQCRCGRQNASKHDALPQTEKSVASTSRSDIRHVARVNITGPK